jgi:hypothetical protein
MRCAGEMGINVPIVQSDVFSLKPLNSLQLLHAGALPRRLLAAANSNLDVFCI